MDKKRDNFYRKHVFMCTLGKTCSKLETTQEIFDTLKNKIREKNLNNEIRINKAGCMNWCSAGPVLVIYPEGKWYSEIKIEDTDKILEDIINN